MGLFYNLQVAPCNGIRNPESREIFMLESGIQDIFYVGIRNPVSWNPESTKVLESRIYLCRIVLVDSSFFLPSHLLAVYLWLFYTCDTRNTCSNLSTQDTPLRGGGGGDIFLMTSASKHMRQKRCSKIRSLTLSSACIGSFFEVYQVESSGF